MNLNAVDVLHKHHKKLERYIRDFMWKNKALRMHLTLETSGLVCGRLSPDEGVYTATEYVRIVSSLPLGFRPNLP